MDAIEYFKTKNRMTDNCNNSCEACALHRCNNGHDLACVEFEHYFTEKAVAAVEQWDKEHPIKTYNV